MLVDRLGRVLYRHFDRFGEPQFTPNTPERNRRELTMERTKPSRRPKGGYRPKGGPPKRELREYKI